MFQFQTWFLRRRVETFPLQFVAKIPAKTSEVSVRPELSRVRVAELSRLTISRHSNNRSVLQCRRRGRKTGTL